MRTEDNPTQTVHYLPLQSKVTMKTKTKMKTQNHSNNC